MIGLMDNKCELL